MDSEKEADREEMNEATKVNDQASRVLLGAGWGLFPAHSFCSAHVNHGFIFSEATRILFPSSSFLFFFLHFPS